MKPSQRYHTPSTRSIEVGVAAEVVGATVAAAETVEAEEVTPTETLEIIQITRIKMLQIQPEGIQDGQPQLMLTPLPVTPASTIIRMAALLIIVPTPSTAAGPTFHPIHVLNLCKIDFLGGLMPK